MEQDVPFGSYCAIHSPTLYLTQYRSATPLRMERNNDPETVKRLLVPAYLQALSTKRVFDPGNLLSELGWSLLAFATTILVLPP